MDKTQYKLLFEEACKGVFADLRNRPEENTNGFSEGAVLNLMFRKMGFDKDYDLVAATFIVKANRYDSTPLQAKLPGIPQRQICVKNSGIITNIAIDDVSERITELEQQALAVQSLDYWGYRNAAKTRYK